MKRALILASLLLTTSSCFLTYYVLAQDGYITRSVGVHPVKHLMTRRGPLHEN